MKQPWAGLVACGAKTIETRSVPTHYRGLLAVHASQKPDPDAFQIISEASGVRTVRPGMGTAMVETEDRLVPGGTTSYHFRHDRFGCILAIARLTGCEPFHPNHERNAITPWRPNAWAWRIDEVQELDEPVPMKGQLGLWEAPDALLRRLAA